MTICPPAQVYNLTPRSGIPQQHRTHRVGQRNQAGKRSVRTRARSRHCGGLRAKAAFFRQLLRWKPSKGHPHQSQGLNKELTFPHSWVASPPMSQLRTRLTTAAAVLPSEVFGGAQRRLEGRGCRKRVPRVAKKQKASCWRASHHAEAVEVVGLEATSQAIPKFCLLLPRKHHLLRSELSAA